MKTQHALFIAIALLVVLPRPSWSEDIHIESFNQNGALSWTGPYTSGTYRAQWSCSLTTGTWCNSWTPLVDLPAQAGLTNSVSVPIFYRIVWSGTNAIVAGAWNTAPPPPPDTDGFLTYYFNSNGSVSIYYPVPPFGTGSFGAYQVSGSSLLAIIVETNGNTHCLCGEVDGQTMRLHETRTYEAFPPKHAEIMLYKW